MPLNALSVLALKWSPDATNPIGAEVYLNLPWGRMKLKYFLASLDKGIWWYPLVRSSLKNFFELGSTFCQIVLPVGKYMLGRLTALFNFVRSHTSLTPFRLPSSSNFSTK